MLEGEVTDVGAVATEVTVANLVAVAANYREGSADVTIVLRVPHVASDSQATWTRREKDMLLLCLDRAVSRVHPPLDPVQYTQSPVEFLLEDGVRVVHLHITPSSLYSSSFSAAPHQVEGTSHLQPSTLTGTSSSSNVNAVDMVLREGKEEEEGDVENAAACARRRWKKAAWMTSRIFNESSWHSVERRSTRNHNEMGEGGGGGEVAVNNNGNNVLDAAMRLDGKRLLHVDVFGMEFVGLIVAVTSRYAYVAVPIVQEEQQSPPPQWVLVSRVGIPSLLAEAKTEVTRKRERNDDDDAGGAENYSNLFWNEDELVSYDAKPLWYLPPDQRVQVTLLAHKVYCKHRRANSSNPAALSIAFEDVAALSCTVVRDKENLTQSLTTYMDLMDIVRSSCARFLRGYGKYTGTSSSAASNSAEERLFRALTDTVSVHLKKVRGRDGRPPVTVSSPQEIPSLVEGTCVEFKAKIDKWHDTTDTAAPPGGGNRGTTNLERIRHTVAAMASTLGGVLLVGVTDDGAVIGHARGALAGLRLSGFCPAMMRGTVTVAEMRAVAGDRPTAMPKDWWKQTGRRQQQQPAAAGENTDRVVTVISVGRGQAPFYTTSRYSVPYMRGFASTVPMHVIICARRITDLLP